MQLGKQRETLVGKISGYCHIGQFGKRDCTCICVHCRLLDPDISLVLGFFHIDGSDF